MGIGPQHPYGEDDYPVVLHLHHISPIARSRIKTLRAFFFSKKISKRLYKKIKCLFFKISYNGFGISEVAEGISQRSGEMPKGHFAYSELCEVARSHYAEKERATRADRRKARGSERFRHNSLLYEQFFRICFSLYIMRNYDIIYLK
ncbi:MAG: hypothetical protein UU95_C0017G0014 [Parcubacteria group bacterium GW2011_GWC2_42_12]|nr:MAG: hypothetical protein UU95_C0017G0014 [Parcubacteria group bacterium GW2011_GWC2_42_12]